MEIESCTSMGSHKPVSWPSFNRPLSSWSFLCPDPGERVRFGELLIWELPYQSHAFQYDWTSFYIPPSPALPVCKPGCPSLTEHKCLVADGHLGLPYLLCGTGFFPSFTPVCMAWAITFPLLSTGNAKTRGPWRLVTPAMGCGGWMGVGGQISQGRGHGGRLQLEANSGRGRSTPLLPAWTDLDREWEALIAPRDVSWYYDSTPKRSQYPRWDKFSGITQHFFAFSRLFLAYIMQEQSVKGLSFTCILQSSICSILSPAEITGGISGYTANIDPAVGQITDWHLSTCHQSNDSCFTKTHLPFNSIEVLRVHIQGSSVPKSLVVTGSVTDFHRNKDRVTQQRCNSASSCSGN